MVIMIVPSLKKNLGSTSFSRELPGSLSNDDSDGNENVISKYNFSFS